MKIAKKYLFQVQKSVFEGHITTKNLNKLKTELTDLIDPETDGVVIYESEWNGVITKETIGVKMTYDTLVI